jgi:hypothetical protein
MLSIHTLQKPAFYTAICFFVLSAIVHGFSLAGINAADKVPAVWALHFGVFLVWFPAILSLRNNPAYQAYRKSGNLKPNQVLQITFGKVPKPVLFIIAAVFIYAIVSLCFMAFHWTGNASSKDGHYFLEEHGKQIGALTKEEYNWYTANKFRTFSAQWMAFNSIAAAILYPFAAAGKK